MPPPDAQIGFLLRRAEQRHLAIFAGAMPGNLTSRQYEVLARLGEAGPQPQPALARLTAMDSATISGVLERLEERGLIARPGPDIGLTAEGAALLLRARAAADRIAGEMLAPLAPPERAVLLGLLRRLG